MKLPTERPKLFAVLLDIVYSLLILLWYILPFLNPSGSFNPLGLAGALYGTPAAHPVGWIVVTVIAVLLPLVCLYKLAAVFLVGFLPPLLQPARSIPAVMNICSSAFTIALIATHIIVFAASGRYFAVFPPYSYAVFLLSVAFNNYSLTLLVTVKRKKNDDFVEYREWTRTSKGGVKKSAVVMKNRGIQRRMIGTFAPLILLIIVVLCFFLLRDFNRTIMAATITNGEGLAERTASVVKANPGDKDRISLEDYFAAEAKKNAAEGTSSFRFNTLSFYRRDSRKGGFELWASTDPKRIGTMAPALASIPTATTHRFNPGSDVFEFVAPVTLSNVFIGYVMVDYARDVIYEPYFRTQVKVFLVAALFMYIATFLTILFARSLVFPIMYLGMSVNTISNSLSGMITGKLKVSTDLLQYKDRIRTRDEIKALSGEIGNMTTVIRGVIPYISASTLQHAQRETPTTERKVQAFLFTDIRGFTSLCEGMSPEDVVEMLNHYLELQSSVIMANSGEVDKFVGDEIMARFEGAKKELNACRAGLQIRQAMAEEKRLAELSSRNVVSIGIGINVGPVVFGSVGAKDRMDFTSIGDTVNLAARLEGANKTYGTKSLITEAVHDKVKTDMLCREIDLLTVKGKRQPVRIFEILQESKKSTDSLVQLGKLFEASLGQYRKQKWDAAEKGFVKLRDEFNDETSEVFLKRIAMFKKSSPGTGWDGVFNLTVK